MDHTIPLTSSRESRKGSMFLGRVGRWALVAALTVGGCTGTGVAPTGGSASRTPEATAPASATAGAAASNAPASPSADPTESTVPVTPRPGATQSSAPASAAPDSTGTAGYPLTLVDDEGTRVTLPAEPARVVSLSPANTETVFALGAGDKLVGGTDFDDYPPEAIELPDVATFEGVLIEQVVDLEPDVVLAAGNNFNPAADIERLRELEIPVVVLYAETVDEVLADIELIGQAVGAADEADALTATMEARIDEITATAEAAGSRPRVFYQIGSEPEIYGPADDSFIADMIELAGGEPITTGDTNVFSISLERLVDADPEVIVLGDANYGVTPDQVKERPGGWAQMTAVREDAVRPIDDTIVTRPGPRLADGLAALVLAIHPDMELPEASPGP